MQTREIKVAGRTISIETGRLAKQADGLVHLSELSWGQVSHPSQVVKVGDRVEVYVVGVDRDNKKIALSLKRLQGEPWSRVNDKYEIGQVVNGRITKLAAFGAFAEIEPGIEGLIHISELSEDRITHPKQVVREGDELALKIIRIEPARHRLGLSLRQVEEESYDDAYAGGTYTIGDDADGYAHGPARRTGHQPAELPGHIGASRPSSRGRPDAGTRAPRR